MIRLRDLDPRQVGEEVTRLVLDHLHIRGVWGNGGGVVIHEVCRHCGCLRTTDTWAQYQTGEQGLTSVTYDDGAHAYRDAWREWRDEVAS